MFPFIDELDRMAEQARVLIEQGEYKKALRLARKLDRSAYSEGWVHATKITALVSVRQGNFAEAKNESKSALMNSWGDPEILSICRLGNPPVSPGCSSFALTIQAGSPFGSPLSLCPDTHQVTFFVVAQDEAEARLYVRDLMQIRLEDDLAVLSVERHRKLPAEADLCGVYWNSTFERRSSKQGRMANR